MRIKSVHQYQQFTVIQVSQADEAVLLNWAWKCLWSFSMALLVCKPNTAHKEFVISIALSPRSSWRSLVQFLAEQGVHSRSFPGMFLFSLNYRKSSCGELCTFFLKQSAPSVFATCVYVCVCWARGAVLVSEWLDVWKGCSAMEIKLKDNTFLQKNISIPIKLQSFS